MGTWGYSWSASYVSAAASQYASTAMFYYKNTSSSTETIKSMTASMGTGNGTYTWGDTVTGSGAAISVWFTANGIKSNTKSVTNKVGTASGSGGTYPPTSQMYDYTFTFSGLEVGAGETVSFLPSFLGSGSGAFVWDKSSVTGVTETKVTTVYYTVTFNANGGKFSDGTSTKTQSVVSGGYATNPGTPTYDSYTFGGWNQDFGPITANTTISAIWNAPSAPGNTYTVKFNANGGYFPDGTTIKSYSVSEGGSVTSPPSNPSRDGYYFNGWDGSYSNVTSDITLYAQWTEEYVPEPEPTVTYYTVVFDLDGGDRIGGGSRTQVVEAGEDADPPICEKEGYTFLGWDGSYTNVQDDLTITALWEEIPPTIYIVTFDLAGGTYTGGGALTQQVEEGDSATPPNVPIKTGYNFLGWSGSYRNIYADTTISATWEEITYTITYYPNGGYGTKRRQEKTYGQAVAILEEIFTNDCTLIFNANGGSVSPATSTIDLIFKGWGVASDSKYPSYQPGQLYTNNADLDLYAIWGANVMGELPTPTLDGGEFTGWYDAQHGGSPVDENTSIIENTTIYAYWNYLIQYDFNGADGVLPNDIKYYDVALHLPEFIPEIKGYVFKGWALSKSATSATWAAGDMYTTNACATLYAVFSAGTFTVTFDLQGGTFVSGGGALVQTVALNGNATLPVDPVHPDGKAFRGWSGQYRGVDSDRTIYARWLTSYIWIMNSSHEWEHLF